MGSPSKFSSTYQSPSHSQLLEGSSKLSRGWCFRPVISLHCQRSLGNKWSEKPPIGFHRWHKEMDVDGMLEYTQGQFKQSKSILPLVIRYKTLPPNFIVSERCTAKGTLPPRGSHKNNQNSRKLNHISWHHCVRTTCFPSVTGHMSLPCTFSVIWVLHNSLRLRLNVLWICL